MVRNEFITFVLIILAYCSTHAQDKIVTWKNDTIDCKIIRNGRRMVIFCVNNNGIISHGKLGQNAIKQIVFNNVPDKGTFSESYGKGWILSMSGGPSFMTTGSARRKGLLMENGLSRPQAASFHQELASGWQCSSTLHYYISPSAASGISYRFSWSSARTWATVGSGDGTHLWHGPMSRKHSIQYVAGSFLFLPYTAPDKKLRVSLVTSAGIVFYRDQESLLETNLLVTGKSLGLSGGLGLDYFISRKISAGLNAIFFYSRLRHIQQNNGYELTTLTPDKYARPDLSAMDVSAAIKFYF